MFSILLGHIIGILLPIFILRNIPVVATQSGGKAMTYLGIVGLILFLEYQLFRSVRYGEIYFRGTVDEYDGSQFHSCRFGYALLAGFFAAILLQNIF